MKFPTNGAKVHWYLYPIVGGVCGHRQEKCYAAWLRSADRVPHYPWNCHVVRHANGHVFATFHPIHSNRIVAIGFAINPARDLGPRIMTAMVGYGRQGTALLSYSVVVSNPFFFFDAVFNYRSQYWIWSPILGSFCGGLVACFLYDVLIYLGPESPINTPCVTTFLPHILLGLNAVYLGMKPLFVTSRRARMWRVRSIRVARAFRTSEITFLTHDFCFVGNVMVS